MSEQTYTVSYMGEGGMTYHPEREITVVWGPKGAERCDPTKPIRGELNWYGDNLSERYVPVVSDE